MGGRRGEPKRNPMKRPMATTAIPTPRDMAHVGRGRRRVRCGTCIANAAAARTRRPTGSARSAANASATSACTNAPVADVSSAVTAAGHVVAVPTISRVPTPSAERDARTAKARETRRRRQPRGSDHGTASTACRNAGGGRRRACRNERVAVRLSWVRAGRLKVRRHRDGHRSRCASPLR